MHSDAHTAVGPIDQSTRSKQLCTKPGEDTSHLVFKSPRKASNCTLETCDVF